jgi:hypothetical protein
MAIEWIEGFQWVADATSGATLETLMNERYQTSNMDAGGTDSVIDSSVPGPGNALSMGDAASQNDFLVIKTPTNPNEIYLSAKFKLDSESPQGGGSGLIQFRSNASDLEIIGVNLGTNQEWIVSRLGTFSVLKKQARDFRINEWCTVEVYVKVGQTDGAWELRINGTTLGSEANVDTLPITAAAHVDDIVIRSNSSNVGPFWRDIIIYNGDGGVNDTWVGEDKHVYAIFPSADTATEDWTRSAGVDSFALIDEVNHDGNTTYIESSTATNVTLVELQNSGSESGITGISVHTTAALDIAGSETFDDVIFEGATTTNSTAHTVTATTYSQFETVYDTNPDTTAAWAASEIDALQTGVEKN